MEHPHRILPAPDTPRSAASWAPPILSILPISLTLANGGTGTDFVNQNDCDPNIVGSACYTGSSSGVANNGFAANYFCQLAVSSGKFNTGLIQFKKNGTHLDDTQCGILYS